MLSTLVAFSLLFQASSAPDARAKAEEQVKNAVHGANLAYAKNDLPVYWSFYGQDLTQFWPTGRVDLPTYKAQWEKFVKDGGRVEQAEVKDLVIQVGPSNDTAVATYLLTVTTRQPDGKAATEVMQETDVLVKRLGAWKVIHLHYSPANPARP
jgi:ketosteroid isomerase-like protein